MSLMRRWVILVLAVLGAAVVPATAHASLLLQPRACPGCVAISAGGGGILSQSVKGLSWGSIASGTIIVLDRSDNGKRDWSVTGYDKKPYKRSDGAWVYQKSTSGGLMCFTVSTSFFVKLKGSGIGVSSVASGTATVSGRGTYNLNGGGPHRWTSTPRTLKLQG